ncbi:hypothetical protein Drorol1_Dr00000031 [Drosera rotundifolia]
MACLRIPEAPLASSGDSDGNKPKGIPLIGFGTTTYPFGSDEVKQSVLNAIKARYRHFDTTYLYKIENPLGEAIAEAISLGFIKSRDELFITSKLWCCDTHPHLVLPSIKKTLKNLGLEFVDLYLIHWPIPLKPGKYEIEIKKEDLLPLDFKGVWEAMEGCSKQGLAEYIGVSNFTCKKLQGVLDIARIPPAVNQTEMNPFWRQEKLREFCKEKGIPIKTHSSLGAAGIPWGGNNVLDSEILKEIAQDKGNTIAQKPVVKKAAPKKVTSKKAVSTKKVATRKSNMSRDWILSWSKVIVVVLRDNKENDEDDEEQEEEVSTYEFNKSTHEEVERRVDVVDGSVPVDGKDVVEEPPVEELKKAGDVASKEDTVNEIEDLGSNDETHKAAMSKGTNVTDLRKRLQLEVENAVIRAEMEASKLSASELVTTCLEVAKRERNVLKVDVAESVNDEHVVEEVEKSAPEEDPLEEEPLEEHKISAKAENVDAEMGSIREGNG